MVKYMKAVNVEKFGGPEVLKLKEIEVPPISKTEVLVKIKSSGVNPVDTYLREGAFPHLPEVPYVPGMDGAGIIERVGSGISKVEIGQRVFVCLLKTKHSGTCAEYAVANESDVYPLSDRLSFNQGAALGIPYFTAHRALILKGGASAGDWVLVHGASGAVGLAVVQIAKAYHMNVIGTAGTKEGMDIVKKNGADYVFCHRDKNYIKQIMKLTEDKKIDVIVEMLANANLNKDLQLLGNHGKVMIVGCRDSVSIDPCEMMGLETQIIGVGLLLASAEEMKETSTAILKGIEDGWINPVIDKTYSMEQASDAHHDIIHSKGAKGKIVLTVDHS